MKYLSVFSGIEAASVAWEPLGWNPVGFSEIDPFASAVLAARFPVTNYGDITKHESWDGIVRGSVDLLVGGSPCQAFSVAGLRRGLEDPRGQLSLVYLQLAARIRPRWIVWENVPGVLSADGGRAFGAFLGALVELGYGFAWRVLDAQHFGVPQRRRRVFLVARDSGDWRSCAEVLLEPKGLPWNHPTRTSAWKKFAADAAQGSRAGGKWWDGSDTAACMTLKGCDQRMPDKGNFAAIVQPIIGTLNTHCGGDKLQFQSAFHGHFLPMVQSFTGTSHAQYAEGVGTLRASGGDLGGGSETIVSIQGNLIGRDKGGPHGVGAQENAPMYTLTKGDVHAVAHAFYSTGGTHGLNEKPEVCPPLKVGSSIGIPSSPAVAIGLDEEMNGSFERMGCLKARIEGGGFEGSVAHTIGIPSSPAVAFRKSRRAQTADDHETWLSDELSNTLNRFDTGDTRTTHIVSTPMVVRRLTPVECERLQGFPDNWTLVPYRGKPSADGPRYKALGNSMAVPCMAWIGSRIDMVEKQHAQR